jgi:hypothetical protein
VFERACLNGEFKNAWGLSCRNNVIKHYFVVPGITYDLRASKGLRKSNIDCEVIDIQSLLSFDIAGAAL